MVRKSNRAKELEEERRGEKLGRRKSGIKTEKANELKEKGHISIDTAY